jgi:ribonucleoside-diphosphate reductase alpha chain
LYATAFEVEPIWIVEAGSRRQKWIDQAQSLNIYMAGASGKKLDDTYKLAWVRGLKTTYYLRTMSATHVEKSTVTSGQLNSVSSGGQGSGMNAQSNQGQGASAAAPTASRSNLSALEIAAAQARAQQIELSDSPATDIRFCGVDDPTCESCQ